MNLRLLSLLVLSTVTALLAADNAFTLPRETAKLKPAPAPNSSPHSACSATRRITSPPSRA